MEDAETQTMTSSMLALHEQRFRTASPSRKRARVDDELADVEEVNQELQPRSSKDAVRDDSYYFPDGSCVLLVEDTLFNVHRSILSRDSSMFSTMFTLPAPRGQSIPVEGSSDDHPIVLAGDIAAEFRNLLWALYALPHELLVVHTNKADLTQLMDIAKLSNKYSFRSLETWALDAVNDLVTRNPPPVFTLFPFAPFADEKQRIAPSDAQIAGLMRLAHTCSHERLLGTMIAVLRRRMCSSIQYAYLAMNLADELDLRELRGIAYMEVLQKHAIFSSPQAALAADEATDNEDEDSMDDNAATSSTEGLQLTSAQQLRLLMGYYRLSEIWEKLRKTPLNIGHSASCSATRHQHGCTQSWLEFWKGKTRCDAVLEIGPADVPGRLKAIGKEFERWGSATYMHPDCRMTAKRKIQEKAKEIEDALPEYFVG